MQEKPKKKLTNLLDQLSPDDLEEIQNHQADTQGAYPVDDSWMLMAEWLEVAGWEAYKEARDNEIPDGEMKTLIEATRKIKAVAHYQNAEANLIGAGAAQSKKPSSVFKSLTKHIINHMKVND